VRPAKAAAGILAEADRALARGYLVLAGGVGLLGRQLARLENGYARFYAALFLGFLVLYLVWGVVR